MGILEENQTQKVVFHGKKLTKYRFLKSNP